MNTYSHKQRWKLVLFVAAILIGTSSMLYTNSLIKVLSEQEQKKSALWAEAQNSLIKIAMSSDNAQDTLTQKTLNEIYNFLLKILASNETVPVILTDENDGIVNSINLDSAKLGRPGYLEDQLAIMKEQYKPIVSEADGTVQYIYHKNSIILTQLFYYPFVQLGVIFLFILVSYLVFSTSRKAEQNRVWVGMSKETAHQLGTPISSLIAWVELLRLKEKDKAIVAEVEKDVKRLETITERFSKIGSTPVLTPVNIIPVLNNSINYIRTRVSDKIVFSLNFKEIRELIVPINVALFEWVIENLCKNAVDAINGNGSINVSITDHIQVVYIDIKDSGKGISKSKYKTVFQPGYTTKKRGWGLGLSLTKRIVEIYHKGKIFVKSSEVNSGTTFRIVLKK